MDCTDHFPSEKITRPENWLFRAVCHCAREGKLERIMKRRDKTGKYEAVLTINGEDLNVTKFFDFVQKQFHQCVKEESEEMIRVKFSELDDVFESIKDAVIEKLDIKLEEEE